LKAAQRRIDRLRQAKLPPENVDLNKEDARRPSDG
jgi:hypothetical protein